MGYTEITSAQVAADAPITETLMGTIKDNDIELELRSRTHTHDGSNANESYADFLTSLGKFNGTATTTISATTVSNGAKYYENLTLNAEVNPGSTTSLSTRGITILCTGTFTLGATGIINCFKKGYTGGLSGNPGSGTGGKGTGGFFGAPGGGGGAGIEGAPGGDGGDQIYMAKTQNGGAGGGTGSAGANGNDAGNIVTNFYLPIIQNLKGGYQLAGAGGGGGGGGAGSGDYGSAGADGGGGVLIIAKNIVLNSGGIIDVRGGQTSSDDDGGGGGGGGGCIFMICENYTDNGATFKGAGGAGGIGYRNGGNGGNGLKAIFEYSNNSVSYTTLTI